MQEALAKGTHFGANHAMGVRRAGLVRRFAPSAERVRLRHLGDADDGAACAPSPASPRSCGFSLWVDTVLNEVASDLINEANHGGGDVFGFPAIIANGKPSGLQTGITRNPLHTEAPSRRGLAVLACAMSSERRSTLSCACARGLGQHSLTFCPCKQRTFPASHIFTVGTTT
jgi:hypothetical protein